MLSESACSLVTRLADSMFTVPNDLRRSARIRVPKKVVITGNIGAGKSTFWRALKRQYGKLHIGFYEEPVDRFTNYHGNDLLDQYYKNSISPLALNLAAMESYLKQEWFQKGCGVWDRDLMQVGLFTSLQYALEKIPCIEATIANNLVAACQVIPTVAIIFINRDPKECLAHIRIRERAQEKDIELKYLEMLDDIHKAFVDRIRARGEVRVIEVKIPTFAADKPLSMSVEDWAKATEEAAMK